MADALDNRLRPSPPPPDAGQPGDERLVAGAGEVLALALGLAKELERLRLARARAVGLRPPNHALLELASQAGEAGLTVTEAALALGVRPQALSGPVAELAEESLLEREVDATDARARRLRATSQGWERLAPGRELEQRLLRALVAQIPQPTVAKLVLTRLRAALGQVLEANGEAL